MAAATPLTAFLGLLRERDRAQKDPFQKLIQTCTFGGAAVRGTCGTFGDTDAVVRSARVQAPVPSRAGHVS